MREIEEADVGPAEDVEDHARSAGKGAEDGAAYAGEVSQRYGHVCSLNLVER